MVLQDFHSPVIQKVIISILFELDITLTYLYTMEEFIELCYSFISSWLIYLNIDFFRILKGYKFL